MAVPMQTLKVTAGNMTAALYYYWRGTPGGKWELYVDSVSVEKASSSATFTSVTVGINWSGASSGELEWTRRATGTTGVKASAASIARGTARKTVTLNLEEYVYNGGASVMNSTSVTLTVPYLPIVSSIATARTSDAAGNVPDPMGKYLKVTVGWSKDPLVTTGSTIAVSSAPDGSGGSATSAGGSGTSATTTLVVGGASSGRRADAAYTVTATATDGEHGAKSLSVTDKTAYTKPVITSVESVRTDPGGDLADEGTCAKVTVGWRVACLGSQTAPTSLSVTLGGASQVKTSSWGGTYGDSRLSGTSEFLFPDVNLDVNSAYGVQVALADSLNSQTKGDTITTAFFTMDVLGDAYWDEEAQEGERPGHGVAWGGACSSEGFWNHMKSFFLNLLRIVKPSSRAPAHALEVSDGDADTATLDWSGNAWFAGGLSAGGDLSVGGKLAAPLVPASAGLPQETATSGNIFPLVLDDSFANGGRFAYMTQANFKGLLSNMGMMRRVTTSGNYQATDAYVDVSVSAGQPVRLWADSSLGVHGLCCSKTAPFLYSSADAATVWTGYTNLNPPPASVITGTLGVAHGGTGQTSLNSTVAATLDTAGIVVVDDTATTATRTTAAGPEKDLSRYRWLILRYTDGARWYTKWVYTNKATSVATSIERSIGSGTTAYYIASMGVTIARNNSGSSSTVTITVNSRTQMTCSSSGNSIASNAGLTLRTIFGVY